MRRLFRLLVVVVIVVVAVPVGLLVASIEPTPAAPDGRRPDAADAAAAKALLGHLKGALEGSGASREVRARGGEIASLLAFLARGVPRLATRVAVTPEAVRLAASVRLPETPLGRYANLRVTVVPSLSGLVIGETEVGRLRLPGGVVTAVLRLVLGAAFGADDGAAVLDAVQALTVENDTVAVRFRADSALGKRLAGRLREAVAIADPKRVRVYVAQIEKIGGGSLAGFIGPLFALAAERSAKGEPVAENRAALMALAMTFGDSRFEAMVGEVRIGALAKMPAPRASLAGRGDLVQHFTISAGLALVSASGVADAIGEFKEIQDTLSGGSGFSFSDLAADRAGVRLARAAIADAASARRVQSRLAGITSEAVFFPPITGLPDNLSEAEFRRRFGDVESESYRRMVAGIDGRIDRLALFAGG